MDALVAWLREQMDEDERTAREATPGPWDWGIPNPRYWRRTEEGPASEDLLCNELGQWVLMTSKAGAVSAPNAEHIARWDPARVLAEVEAKRTRIAMLVDTMSLVGSPVINEEYRTVLAGVMQSVTWHLLRLEAQPYSARPGFKDEWRLT